MKQKLHTFLNTNKRFLRFLYALILLNVLVVFLDSYENIHEKFDVFDSVFEIISVIIFSFEYLGRIYVADLNPGSGKPWQKRLKYMRSGLGIIDLFAIIPFYLPLLLPVDLRVLRILRLGQMLRIFKLARISRSFKVIRDVLRDTRNELLMTMVVAMILLFMASTIMYFIEHTAQPDKFANIGDALWWAVATLTTVGYGDVYPVTNLGKILSGAIALIGVGFIALPTGIISSAFIERTRKAKESNIVCPHCGKKHG